ncbi:MAG: ribosome biogenesis GTPase Der [Thermomicrobiales bacterium]
MAIVGRPNVGKSTLFNRLVGSRRSIVGDEPGITRDRIYGEAEWLYHRIRVVDTGGIIPEDKQLIPSEIFRQARVAFDQADAIVLVVDGRSELASPDMELARLLIRTGKPLFLAVNKIDSVKQEPYAEEFRRLGIQRLLPVSAEHGNGVAELLEALVEVLPEAADEPYPEVASTPAKEVLPEEAGAEPQLQDSGTGAAAEGDYPPAELEETGNVRETKVAIIGRPNVGKSTLLNALTSSERAIVSPIPGTPRDAVDEMVEREGERYRFIDTAGIRRKGKTHMMAEKLSVIMARKHLEAADIALLVIDASEGVTALDANIAGYAHESGRSVIIVINKWDLVGTAKAAKDGAGARTRRGRSTDRRPSTADYEQEVRDKLKFLSFAPVVFVSASIGRNVEKIFPLVTQVAAERRKRVTTSEMNRFLAAVDFERASVPASKRVKIYYMTQAGVSPPKFILFTDRAIKLHFAYERFLENQIRRAFGFVGTPIWLKVRESS